MLLITRNDSGHFGTLVRYLVSPRNIAWIGPGLEVESSDIYNTEMTVDEFVELVSQYDVICFGKIDDTFIEDYGDAFDDESKMVESAVYHVNIEDGVINLYKVSEY